MRWLCLWTVFQDQRRIGFWAFKWKDSRLANLKSMQAWRWVSVAILRNFLHLWPHIGLRRRNVSVACELPVLFLVVVAFYFVGIRVWSAQTSEPEVGDKCVVLWCMKTLAKNGRKKKIAQTDNELTISMEWVFEHTPVSLHGMGVPTAIQIFFLELLRVIVHQ